MCLKQFGGAAGAGNPSQPGTGMQGQGMMPQQGNMNPTGTGTNMPPKPPMGGDGMMMPPNGSGEMMQKPGMDGTRPLMQQPGMFKPGTPPNGFNGAPPANTMPPQGGTESKPQAANFSQNLVAGAAMPFVLLWNLFR
jgi:hypothetical protein